MRTACWPFHTLYRFRCKHVLHNSSCMRSVIMYYRNEITNGFSIWYNMRSECVVNIYLGLSTCYWWYYTHHYVCLCWFRPIPSIHFVYIMIFTVRTQGYFEGFFASIPENVRYHTPELNSASSVGRPWFQSHCIWYCCWNFKFFRPHSVFRWKELKHLTTCTGVTTDEAFCGVMVLTPYILFPKETAFATCCFNKLLILNTPVIRCCGSMWETFLRPTV